jgi:AraC-like DNA-binding protein
MKQAFREGARRAEGITVSAFDVSISPRGYNNWHYHDDIELVVIAAGGGTRFVGDSIDGYEAGEVVLLGSRLPHTWCPTQGVDSGGAAHVVHFDPSVCDPPELAEVGHMFTRAQRGLLFPAHLARPLTALIADVQVRSGCRQMVSVMTVLANLVEHLSDAAEICGPGYPVRRNITPREQDAMERIEAVRALVAARLHEPLVQSEVADEIGMEPTAFCRFFRRQAGRTFTRYVQELRLSAATQLLAQTSMSVTSIAATVGFGNLAHFNRCFKRYKGMTPTEWRRRFARPADVELSA